MYYGKASLICNPLRFSHQIFLTVCECGYIICEITLTQLKVQRTDFGKTITIIIIVNKQRIYFGNFDKQEISHHYRLNMEPDTTFVNVQF